MSKYLWLFLAAVLLLQTNPDEQDFEKMLQEWYHCKWPVYNPAFLNSIRRKDYLLFSTFTVDLDATGKRKASFISVGPVITPYGKNGTGIGGNNC